MKLSRGIKTARQVSEIKKACSLGDKVYSQILKKIRIGTTEHELSLEIQKLIRKNNARLAFRPIVAFGKNAYEIHHKPTNKKLNKNHGFVLLDFGAKVNGYCSDMSRTVFFGKATKRQKRMYQTVLKAQQKAVNFISIHSSDMYHHSAKEVDRVAREYIISKGYPSIPHSLGHGIGRKVHQVPKIGSESKAILKNGMVFTIEPGIYIKNFCGVRIEDVFYLNKGKLHQLTKSSKELLEL